MPWVPWFISRFQTAKCIWWSWVFSKRKSHRDLTVCTCIFTHRYFGISADCLCSLGRNVARVVAGVRGWSQQVRVQSSGRAGWGSLDCSCLHKIWPQINQTASVSTAAVPKPPWAKITKVQEKKIDFWSPYKMKKNFFIVLYNLWIVSVFDSSLLKANLRYSGASTTRVHEFVGAEQVRQDPVLMLINRAWSRASLHQLRI